MKLHKLSTRKQISRNSFFSECLILMSVKRSSSFNCFLISEKAVLFSFCNFPLQAISLILKISILAYFSCIKAKLGQFLLPRWCSGKEFAANAEATGDMGSIPGLRGSPGGNGNPLQYSCLENSMDRGVWQATVQRVTQSQTHQLLYSQRS